MTQAVHIAFLGARVFQHGGVAALLEKLAGAFLVLVARRAGRFYTLVSNKYYIDEFYGKFIVKPAVALGTLLFRFDNSWVIDPFVNLVDNFILEEIQSSGIDKPILVTNDRIFQLQARLRGIKSEIYKESVPFKSEAEYFTGFVAAREESVPNAFMWNEQGKPLFFGPHGEKIIDYQHKVWKVTPRNIFQNLALELMTHPDIDLVSVQSEAGYGKSYLALATALYLVLERKSHQKIFVIKPTIEIGQKLGYLPGKLEEKMEPYTRYIADLVTKLHRQRPANKIFMDGDVYPPQFNPKTFEILPLAYIRGMNIENAVVVIDDASTTTATIGNNADIVSASSLSVSATGNQTIKGESDQVSAGAVGAGASFVKISVGNDSVTDTQAFIGSNVDVGQVAGKTVGSVSVSASSTVTAEARVHGISAGIGAFSANFAFTDIGSDVKAFIGDSSNLKVSGEVQVASSLKATGLSKGIGVAAGGLAVGAMVADVSLGRGDDVDEVQAGIGDGTSVEAGTLRITATATDDLFADSLAGSGGGIAITGAIARVSDDNTTLVSLGDGADVKVATMDLKSMHDYAVDSQADSYTIGLGTGTGAFAHNTITGKAVVDIGPGATVSADSIYVTAMSKLTKQKLSPEENNLRAATFSGVGLSFLESRTNIGTDDHPLETTVQIGTGAILTAGANHASAGVMEIQAYNDILSTDSDRLRSD